MCNIDYADGATEFSFQLRRHARKEHRCDECGRAIQPGEIYYYTSGVFDGEFQVAKTCWHCRVGQQWLIENCGGYIIGEVGHELREHADEYPDLAEDLNLFCEMMGAQWRARDGSLMRAPTMPPRIDGGVPT